MERQQVQAEDFAASYEAAFARLRVRVETACARQGDWPNAAAAGIRAAFAFAAEYPGDARLLTTEALTGGEPGQRLYQRTVDYFARALRHGQDLESAEPDLPSIHEAAMAGGIAILVSRRLEGGLHEELPEIAAEAIEFVLTPYVGADKSRRLARRHDTID